jgi:hypothetical protein
MFWVVFPPKTCTVLLIIKNWLYKIHNRNQVTGNGTCRTSFIVIYSIWLITHVHTTHSAHFLHTCFSLILISSPHTVQPLGYRPDEWQIRIHFQAGVKGYTFVIFTGTRPALELTQPPNQWVLEALSPGIKHPEHEPDHSTPSSTKVKKAKSYAFIVSCVFYGA